MTNHNGNNNENNNENNENVSTASLIITATGSLLGFALFVYALYRAFKCSKKYIFTCFSCILLYFGCYLAYTLAKGCVKGVYSDMQF